MEYEKSIERVCLFLIELSKSIRDLSLIPEINDLNKGNKYSALEDLIKLLDRTTPVIEKKMCTLPKEESECTPYLTSILGNIKKTQEGVENSEPILETQQIENNKSINVDVEMQSDKEEILLKQTQTIQKQESNDEKQRSKSPARNIIKCICDTRIKIETELDFIETQYKVLQEMNKAREKDLYTLPIILCFRKKSEKEYLEMLEKYDEDVGSFYRTMKSLTQESTLLDTKLKDLEDKVAVQKIIYDKLKTERETELIKAFTRDLDNFKRNRAARIIQNSWRKYLEKLVMRKKKKSKKKR